MRRKPYPICRLVLFLSTWAILLPLLVVGAWCVTERWAWPALFPQVVSLRGLQEILQGQALSLLLSSILLSAVTAVLAAAVGVLTARACFPSIYRPRPAAV